MRLLFSITLATVFAGVLLSAHAADLATYPFNGNLDAETADGITASGFLATGGSNAKVSVGNNDGSYGYILITQSSTNVGDAVDNEQFAQFTITPPPQNGMQIAQIQVIASRGGDSTPRGLALRWSLDGYRSNLGTANVTSTWPSKKTYTFNVNAFSGGPVGFRLYAYAKEASKAQASIRFSELVVTGDPVIYAPTVTPETTRATTARNRYVIRGTAFDSSGITRVEVAKNSVNGVYSGANGTTKWRYPATPLKTGNNIFYVRSVDRTGQTSTPVKVTVKRTKASPTPSPSPTP